MPSAPRLKSGDVVDVAIIKYLFDEHMPNVLADQLRHFGIDVLTSHEAGLRRRTDESYILIALKSERAIVTLDEDFERLHHEGVRHSGTVYAKPNTVPIGIFVDFLKFLHDAYDSDFMTGRLERL